MRLVLSGNRKDPLLRILQFPFVGTRIKPFAIAKAESIPQAAKLFVSVASDKQRGCDGATLTMRHES